MHVGDLPDHSPNQPTELDIEELEKDTIYAVLSYRGDFASWNWGFYVPDPSKSPIGSSGTIFHVVNESASPPTSPSSSTVVGNEWKLEVVRERDIISWPLLVAIVELADVGFLGCEYEELVGKDTLLPLFESVHIPKTVNKSATALQQQQLQQSSSSSSPLPPPPPLSTLSTPPPPLQQQQPQSQLLTEFSSRMWFLDAIFVLHDCGMLQCDDVWLLERELRRCAFKAMGRYLDNRGWTAYKAERCS